MENILNNAQEEDIIQYTCMIQDYCVHPFDISFLINLQKFLTVCASSLLGVVLRE